MVIRMTFHAQLHAGVLLQELGDLAQKEEVRRTLE